MTARSGSAADHTPTPGTRGVDLAGVLVNAVGKRQAEVRRARRGRLGPPPVVVVAVRDNVVATGGHVVDDHVVVDKNVVSAARLDHRAVLRARANPRRQAVRGRLVDSVPRAEEVRLRLVE